jgi:transposase-like protein
MNVKQIKIIKSKTFIKWFNENQKITLNNERYLSKNITSDTLLVYLYSFRKINTIEIAEIFDISRSMIYRKLKKLDITQDNYEAQGVSIEKVNKGINLYKEGKSLRYIAATLGVNKSSVNRWVKKINIVRTTSEARGVTSKDIKKAIKLYVQGKTLKQCADKVEVSDTAVLRWLKKNKTDIRTQSETQSKRASEGRQPIWGIRFFVSDKKGIEHRADSVYEGARFLQHIYNIKVKNVERCKLQIKLSTGKHYNPDLSIEYTDGQFVIEEIKPCYKRNNLDVLLKEKEARKYLKTIGIKYLVVTEKEIGINGFNLLDTNKIRLLSKDDQLKFDRALKKAKTQSKN